MLLKIAPESNQVNDIKKTHLQAEVNRTHVGFALHLAFGWLGLSEGTNKKMLCFPLKTQIPSVTQ